MKPQLEQFKEKLNELLFHFGFYLKSVFQKIKIKANERIQYFWSINTHILFLEF